MQGFDPQTILPRIAARGLERQEIRPGDWFDDGGVLMCGKCGEPRQGMVTVPAPMEGNPENKMTFKATRSCKCDRDKEAAEKQAEQNKKDMERVARLKKASLMDEKLREASFDSFQVTKYNARNLKLCRRYAEAFDEMVSKNQGLIFWGSVGTGMTASSRPATRCSSPARVGGRRKPAGGSRRWRSCSILTERRSQMEMKQRVQHLIADVERACIKYKLNMTIYDGKLAFVDQESRHIVATWGPQFKLSEEPEHGGE